MRFLRFVLAFSLLLSLTACSKWSAAYYAARGDAYLEKGDYDKAIQDYDQAISRDPRLAHAFAAGRRLPGKGRLREKPFRITTRPSAATQNLRNDQKLTLGNDNKESSDHGEDGERRRTNNENAAASQHIG